MRFHTALRYFGYGVLALATLEIAARVEDAVRHGASMLAPYSINTVFQPSPYGKEGKPGASYLKWHMNSLGYRGPELASGRTNVLAFGASETFGLYESPGEEYPRQLEAELNRAAPGGYNVVNIAIPGLRIGRTGYLERAIRQTHARYVVIYPSPANYIGTTTPFCGQADQPIRAQTAWSDQIRLLGRFDQLAKRTLPATVMTASRRLSIWNETRSSVVMDHVPQASIDAFATDLECVIEATRALDAVPIVVTHATLFGPAVSPETQDMLVAWRKFYPELAEAGFLDLEQRANAAAEQVAMRTQVPLVRADRAIAPGRANFADFVHFSDQGAHEMASLLRDTILDLAAHPAAQPIAPQALSQ